MRLQLVLCCAGIVLAWGCATSDIPTITPDQVTWIEKGKTTRDEVNRRLGLTGIEATGSKESSIQPTAFFTKSDTGMFSGTNSRPFWIQYDQDGVVQDFGFDDPPLAVATKGSRGSAPAQTMPE